MSHHFWTINVAFLCLTLIIPYALSVMPSYSTKDVHNWSCHNGKNKYTVPELTDEELFRRGHLKPFGSHRPPDQIVEELPFMISPQDFYMKYVLRHKPVVIKGAVKQWPAYKLWTDEYLNNTYGDVMFNMETKDDDKLNLPNSMKLKQFLRIYQHADRYLVDEVPPEMRKEIVLPLCLRCEEIDKYFFVSYFWFSNGNTSSKIHLDTDENMLCVVRGHKEVLMVSPEYSDDIHADSSRLLGVLDINVASVDLEKYPRVKNVHYVKANVDEGDMVYIPQMWWHHVYSRAGRQQAVALWWKSKPALKDRGRKSSPIHEQRQQERRKVKYSYARVLAEYEQWVQNISDDQPSIVCKEQQILMSEYQFETDKSPDSEQTLGDGGDLEEEDHKAYQEHFKQAKLSDKQLTGEYLSSQLPCDFDRENLKSPCYYKPCLKDDNDLKCLRYMLDYCGAFEDRGCVIQLPHLMNKLEKGKYKVLKTMKTDFG